MRGRRLFHLRNGHIHTCALIICQTIDVFYEVCPAKPALSRRPGRPFIHDVKPTRLLTWSRWEFRTFLMIAGEAGWWSQTGSNRRPHACKARALPTELWPLLRPGGLRRAGPLFAEVGRTCLPKPWRRKMVGPGRLELPTSRLSGVRSNQLSYGPEARAGARDVNQDAGASRRRSETRKGARDQIADLTSARLRAPVGDEEERETKTAAPRTCVVH